MKDRDEPKTASEESRRLAKSNGFFSSLTCSTRGGLSAVIKGLRER